MGKGSGIRRSRLPPAAVKREYASGIQSFVRIALTRRRRYDRKYSLLLRQLYRLIEGMMGLPAPLSDLAWNEIHDFAKEKGMPFMTGADRYEQREALLMGIEAVLDVKFGAPGLALLPEIRQIKDADLLREILQAVKQADDPEALRRVWAED